jgi:hypothetical protein
MEEKHPSSPVPSLPEGPPPEAFTFTPTQVLAALTTFKTGTAAGPSQMRASHFKEAVMAPEANKSHQCLCTMTEILNILSQGKVPDPVTPYIFGANLLATSKKDSGHRPIAVEESLR